MNLVRVEYWEKVGLMKGVEKEGLSNYLVKKSALDTINQIYYIFPIRRGIVQIVMI